MIMGGLDGPPKPPALGSASARPGRRASRSSKTDTPHEILPARIGPLTVEHRQRELDDSKDSLLVRLLESVEQRRQVAERRDGRSNSDTYLRRGNAFRPRRMCPGRSDRSWE